MTIETKKVKELINLNPGKSKLELAGILGVKFTTFIYHYKKLLKNGEIKKIDEVTSITPEKVKELEKWFTYWFNDEEACLQAEIPTSTFYDYCRNNPDWADRRQVLKKSTTMHAKMIVAKKVMEEEKDDYVKMVYQENNRKERAEVRVNLWVTKEDEEEIETKQISLKVTFSD